MDLRMFWREAGEGEAVLLIHGFPFDGTMWEPQLAAPPAGWRLLAPDLRGFGETPAGGSEPFSMDTFADDLAGLLDQAGVERAVVCGLSMGGYIAFALWRRHPARVRALVLCDTRAGADSEEGRRGRAELAAKVKAEGSRAASEAMLPRLLSEWTRRKRPEAVERVRAMMEANPPETVVRALGALAERPDSGETLATITVPTLVVVGAEDVITPVAEAERLAREIPDAELEVLEEAGHVSNLERPREFNRALARFLGSLPPMP